MRVTKKMYDKELRGYYRSMKILGSIWTKEWLVNLLNRLLKGLKGKNIEGLHCEERYIPSKNNGPDIRIRIFRPINSDKNLPGLLYNHGGGYMLGIPELALDQIEQFMLARPCVIVAPDYRKSIKNPYPAGFNDCYDTLLWMKENATSLGINPLKFIVAGHSAGGGLTAAVTLKAQETKDVNIAFQMPIYPMIDHRQNTESAKNMDSAIVWNGKANAKGWNLYLQNTKGKIPLYASPSLNSEYKNFPPTITFVGDLEPFKDETINYVEALRKENVPVKFELFKGAFHGFDAIAKKTTIGKKANQFQFQAFAEYVDKYM
jgi:acetyl esterase/lipase